MDSPHSLILEGRERLTISGVEDVESFNEQQVVAVTSRGTLIISGTSLHIERLSLDMGELLIEGEVAELRYEDAPAQRGGGIFSRLFG